MRGIVGTLLFALLLSASVNAGASTITAASCSAGDVQAALNQASAGDTVFIPAGTCHWTTQVSWTVPANATLQGAGSDSVLGGGDVTVIIDDDTTNQPLLLLALNSSGTFRMYGITIQGGLGVLKDGGVLSIRGSSAQMRIDHIHFNMQSYTTPYNGRYLYFSGPLNGVVDHIIVDLERMTEMQFDGGTGGAPGTYGDERWAAATNFGGSDFIFVEDGTFNARRDPVSGRFISVATDCRTGGKFVLRYNTAVAAGVTQTHPTGGSGRGRGCRANETYGNTVTAAPDFNPGVDGPLFVFAWESSGPALVWGNTASGVFKQFTYVTSMRKSNATYTQSATPAGWGYCGTEFNGTGSNWDQNTNATTGYACLDQPGRGQGDLLSGTFPNAVNTTTGTIAWPHQALEPVREWLNTFTAVSGWGNDSSLRITTDSSSRLVANQDYYSYTATFDGTTGVGVGTRASRPATCTAGVAYWSTDQGGNWNTTNGTANDGTLDVCTATNTWTNAVYTPYPYPHPLTKTVPPAPTNLTVN